MFAGKVTLFLKQNNLEIPYDEGNRDYGGKGNYDNSKTWLRFPDYDVVLRNSSNQAGNHITNILKNIKDSINQQMTEVKKLSEFSQDSPVIYNMLYKGSADTQVAQTGKLDFKLSVTGGSQNSKTWIFYTSPPKIPNLKGNGEQTFSILVKNNTLGETFVVVHSDDGQTFVQVYGIIGQVKYYFIRERVGNLSTSLAQSRIPLAYQQALAAEIPPSVATPVTQQPVQPIIPTPLSLPPTPVQPQPQSTPVVKNPLIEKYVTSSLYGLSSNQWNEFGKVKIQLRETFGAEPFFEDFANISMLNPAANCSLREFHERLSNGTLPTWAEVPKMYTRYNENITSEYSCLAILPNLSFTEEQWIGLTLSKRLGLPLHRVTLRYIALEYEDETVKALSLPFVAPIDKSVPVAVVLAEPNGWNRYYDTNLGLLRRSFPTISGIGSPLLRNVLPNSALSNPQTLKDACDWYALTPDLLDRLKDGSPQSVCFFLIHHQGIEMHFTVIQKKLPEDDITSQEDEHQQPQERTPTFWLDLAGVRLLELRYLVKFYPDIANDKHYKALLAILNMAHLNHVFYTYEPSYYWDTNTQQGDKRASIWTPIVNRDPISVVIPYDEDHPAWIADESHGGSGYWIGYKDHFSKEMINMLDKSSAFQKQWDPEIGGTDAIAFQKLREMKEKALRFPPEGSGSVQAQLIDLDWWEYSEDLCNARLDPVFGTAFAEVCTSAVSPSQQ
jgi:hypothetical protein